MGHQLSAKVLGLHIIANRSISSLLLFGCVFGGVLQPTLKADAFPLPHGADGPSMIGEGNVQVTFVPPNGDAPRETRGGAARDSSCLQLEDANPSLTALVPQSNYGLTTQSHPIFLVYIPSVPTGSVFFNLRDEEGQSVYETFLPLQNTSGVATIEMPKEAPPLEVGKTYEWGIAVPCSARLRPDSPFVSGWVQRTEDGQSGLSTDSLNPSLEYAQQYGQEGFWYDMIALLAKLKEDEPESSTINSNWQNVLQSANLGGVGS